jgi:DNA mismatch repair protein MutL
MGRISLLDEGTANKIAAGEVVERPAAVVKELVENAIDAGATKIDVHIQSGGLESIRVSDDGCGMSPEDVPLSLYRHATSKIKTAEDLFSVRSMGFRGEALPSIAAVSRFRLMSRQANVMAGTEIIVHGGKTVSSGEVGCPVGTEVRVDDLFFNTPARLKFLKTQGSESAKVTDTVQRLALAWPEISFSLTVNGKTQLTTAGNHNLEDAAAQVLGRQNMRQMFPLAWQGELLSLRGFLARPSLSRANRNLQYFFVNRRPVKSPLLSDALQTAYQTLLPRNRFPAAIVFIELDPHEVDVNVHPAKREVRFSQERDIYRHILAGVRDALRGASLIPEVSNPTGSAVRETAANLSFYDYSPNFNAPARHSVVPVPQPPWAQTPEDAPNTHTPADKPAAPMQESAQREQEPSGFPRLRPIGQYLATYILAQSESGELYIVDQHAAHERILYESLKKDVSGGGLPVQEVLPQKFELDAQTAVTLESSLKVFAQFGLNFESFGNNTFILRTVPLFFRQCLNQDDLVALIDHAQDRVNTTSLFEKTLVMMACKAAVKANHTMDIAEMARLLENLAQSVQPHTCPHGRPTVLVFNEQALARNFRRQ